MAESFFDRKIDPFRQALWIFIAGLVAMSGAWLLDKMGVVEMERLFPWSIATGFLLLFGIFNSVMSLTADSFMKYWSRSIYAFLGLALANGLGAWAISGVSVGQAQSYRWIYVVVTFGFIVFLTIVNMLKKIVSFAEREEWNQPRNRR